MNEPTPWSRIVSGLVLALLLTASFQVDYLRVLGVDRSSLASRIDHLRFGKLPEIRAFLHEVARRTEPGDSIALVIPASDWNRGYEYAFYRAAYVAAGRTVLPVMTPAGNPIPQNMETADFVAAWRVSLDETRFEIIWQGEGGVLARSR
ncbi:MAG: hypothetical protein KY432_02280 [Acidobacteria bacterium]|nr:hypothetical protein [Acidobacteriota bacterium]